MGIRFYCPNGHRLNVKAFQAGKRGICPYCGASVQIPLESTRTSSRGRWKKRTGRRISDEPTRKEGQEATGQESEKSEPAVQDSLRVKPAESPPAEPTAESADAEQAEPEVELLQAREPSPSEASSEATAQPEASEVPQELGAQDGPAPPVGPIDVSSATKAESSPGTTSVPPLPPQAPQPPPPLPGEPDPLAEAPAAIWYVRTRDAAQYGPATAEIMRTWLAEGRVASDSLVWREGWRDWREAAAAFPQLDAGQQIPDLVDIVAKESPTSRSGTGRPSPSRRRNNTTNAILIVLLLLAAIVLLIVLYIVLSNQGGGLSRVSIGPEADRPLAVRQDGLLPSELFTLPHEPD